MVAIFNSSKFTKIGRDIHSDLNILASDFPRAKLNEPSSDRVLDIRDTAIEKGLLRQGDPASLNHLAASLLKQRLPDVDTTASVRYTAAIELSDQRTLALDPWIILRVHEGLLVTEPAPSTQTSTPSVSLTWGNRVLAHGVVEEQPMDFTIIPENGRASYTIPLSNNRTVVTITEVLAPAAQVHLHEKQPLSSFGAPPFKIIVPSAQLRPRCQRSTSQQDDNMPAGTSSSGLALQPGQDNQCSPADTRDVAGVGSASTQLYTLPAGSTSSINVNDETGSDGGDGFPSDDDDEPEAAPATTTAELLSTQPLQLDHPGVQAMLPPDIGMLSRVLEDVWHVMHRVMKTIPNGHSLRKPFATAFSKTLLMIDEDDRRMVDQALAKRPVSTRTTWDELRKTNPEWLWRRVRRYVPKKEYLVPVLEELFQCWGDAKCSKTGLPLFNQTTWKKAEGVLQSVRNGWVSDPDGISLYVKIRLDKEGLTVYRCLRGTNSVEGGIHMVLMRIFGSLNASVELADSAIADWRHRHNTDVSSQYLSRSLRILIMVMILGWSP